MTVIGQGSVARMLQPEEVGRLLAEACEPLPVDGKRVLVIIPDGTRTAPIPLFFELLYENLGRRAAWRMASSETRSTRGSLALGTLCWAMGS